ncbi:MAG: WG repeat-containing protein [Clostridiales bacterium]|nr:WG repeat-containing protein [Clostridiales bacterium]
MNNKTRLLISILFILSIGLAIAVTRFNLSGNYKGFTITATPDIQSVTSITYDNYTVFSNSENLYGVIDNNDRIIIEPVWNDITFTSSGKMIVLKNISNNYYSGIIDNQDNILIPCIYSEFKEINSEVIFGYLHENKKIVVFNGNFVPYVNEEWDSCAVKDSFLFLYKDSTRYMGRIDGEKLDLVKMDISDNIMSNDFKLSIYGDKYKINSNHKLLQEVFDQSKIIFEQLFVADIENPDASNSQAIQNASMEGYDISKLLAINMDVCGGINTNKCYKLEIKFQCILKSELELDRSLQNKLNYAIEICMIKDRNGKLAIKSIDKTQITS